MEAKIVVWSILMLLGLVLMSLYFRLGLRLGNGQIFRKGYVLDCITMMFIGLSIPGSFTLNRPTDIFFVLSFVATGVVTGKVISLVRKGEDEKA